MGTQPRTLFSSQVHTLLAAGLSAPMRIMSRGDRGGLDRGEPYEMAFGWLRLTRIAVAFAALLARTLEEHSSGQCRVEI